MKILNRDAIYPSQGGIFLFKGEHSMTGVLKNPTVTSLIVKQGFN
jgi:hypothetical protein